MKPEMTHKCERQFPVGGLAVRGQSALDWLKVMRSRSTPLNLNNS